MLNLIDLKKFVRIWMTFYQKNFVIFCTFLSDDDIDEIRFKSGSEQARALRTVLYKHYTISSLFAYGIYRYNNKEYIITKIAANRADSFEFSYNDPSDNAMHVLDDVSTQDCYSYGIDEFSII